MQEDFEKMKLLDYLVQSDRNGTIPLSLTCQPT